MEANGINLITALAICLRQKHRSHMPSRWLILLFTMSAWMSDAFADKPHDPSVFEPEIRKFEVVDRRTPPPLNAILFTGSSSIRLWTNLTADFPNRVVLNRGFGGSHMSDLLHFFDRVVVPYRPKLIVVYEGDNDLASGKTVDAVVADYREFVRRVEVQLPGTPVAFLAVKHSRARLAQMEIQRELNTRLKAIATEGKGLSFVDTCTPILDRAGQPRAELFRDDGLHLNERGYLEWQRVVGDFLQHAPSLPKLHPHQDRPSP
jgi:lysophospholipase L1-like esterase